MKENERVGKWTRSGTGTNLVPGDRPGAGPAERNMGAIDKIGYDPISKRDLFILDIPSSAHLPADLSLTTPQFVCLIAWDVRSVSVDEISRVAVGLLRQGAVYVCAWGPDCERVHNIVDEAHVGPNPSSDVAGVVMTTSHPANRSSIGSPTS